MKAISFHQPQAQAIASGRRRFDIRAWRSGHRGELFIHAAQTKLAVLRDLWGQKPWCDWFASWGFEKPLDVPVASLIGKATLVDCLPLEEFSFAAGERPVDLPERGWVWLFNNPTLLPRPRMHPGRLGVFEVS